MPTKLLLRKVKWFCAKISFSLDPNPRDYGITISDKPTDISQGQFAAVKRGIESALTCGPQGWKVTDIQITIYNIQIDPQDITWDLEALGHQAIAQALQKAKTKILEPIMEVRIETSFDYLGNILRK